MFLQQQTTNVFATPVPWLLDICIDCTCSISDSDFKTMQQEIVNLLLNIHRRSQFLKGYPSDFVSITAFETPDKIFGPSQPIEIVKMDNPQLLKGLCQWINSLKNDGGPTALYDAIVIGVKKLAQLDSKLPKQYLKVVLAVTDGMDNGSKTSCSSLPFPNSANIHLAVIGVGSSGRSELSKLAQKATSTHSIHKFDELFNAISISLANVIQQTTTVLR